MTGNMQQKSIVKSAELEEAPLLHRALRCPGPDSDSHLPAQTIWITVIEREKGREQEIRDCNSAWRTVERRITTNVY